jgi:hypothetical protein
VEDDLMRSVLLSVSLFAVFPAVLPPQNIVEAWMRAGDRAAQQGQWADAVLWYEKAEATPFDPGRVAFNLATARYHLALHGQSRELSAAEAGYRAVLVGERRGRALLGLGNCFLLRATSGDGLDPALLRAAIDQYRAAIQADPEVREAARYNQTRARLLLLQVVPRFNEEESRDPEDAAGEDSKEEPNPSPSKTPDKNGTGDSSDTGSQRVPTKDGKGALVIEEKDRPGGAGSGTPAPLPNRPGAAPVASTTAQDELRVATQRILEEWRATRRARLVPRAGSGADW